MSSELAPKDETAVAEVASSEDPNGGSAEGNGLPFYRVDQGQQTALERYISLNPIIAFGLTLQFSWEGLATSFQAALLNGGPVSLSYGVPLVAFGVFCTALSLAEMASIEPTVGAQYRWSARHCPRWMNPTFWGLLQGWLTFFGWVAGCAIIPFLLGQTTVALAIFNNPNYVPERWHVTLLAWAFVTIPVIWNIFARRILVFLEIIGGLLHILLFFVIIITLLVLAPRSSNKFVWATTVHDVSGWTNPGVAFSLGLLSPTFVLVGFDGLLHMSDEVKDAPKNVPRGMLLTVLVNSTITFAFTLVILYCLGDYEKALTTPTGLPFIEVVYGATGSVRATNALVSLTMIVIVIGNFNNVASVSRLAWAFARDGGLPFSKTFSYVHPTLKIPLNALFLVSILGCLLALINIGSTTAFLAILSLGSMAVYISYLVPIAFLLIRKLEGRPPAFGPFKLGRWGIPVHVYALIWGIYIVIWLPFPVSLPVTGDTMNYAAPVWFAGLLFALGDWFISGHKRFRVPTGVDDEWRAAQRTHVVEDEKPKES